MLLRDYGEHKSVLSYVYGKAKYLPGLLSFMFVSDRSFKFLTFQIGPLSFEFVSDRSF